MLADTKVSKAQFSKIIQSICALLSKFAGPLMKFAVTLARLCYSKKKCMGKDFQKQEMESLHPFQMKIWMILIKS